MHDKSANTGLKAAALAVAMVLSSSTMAAGDKEDYPVDKNSGLIMAPGWEMVKQQCNACHSSKLVAQNSGNREVWRGTLQWMIDTQGLWDLSDTWEPVLKYLSTYYGGDEIDMATFRRLPLTKDQLPPSRAALKGE